MTHPPAVRPDARLCVTFNQISVKGQTTQGQLSTTSHFSLRKTANRVELKGQTNSPPNPGAFDTQLRATPHKVALTLGKLTELSFTASPLKVRAAQWLESGGTFFQIHTDIYMQGRIHEAFLSEDGS